MPSWFVARLLSSLPSSSSLASTPRPVLLGRVPSGHGRCKVKRYQAVAARLVLAFLVTIYAVFSSTFTIYMKDFVDVMIVWITPWFAIFLVDWVMRRYRYVPPNSSAPTRAASTTGKAGIFWQAIIAQVVGMYAAFSGPPPDVPVPRWPNSDHYGARADSYGYGADFCVFMVSAVAGLSIWALACEERSRSEADRQHDACATPA